MSTVRKDVKLTEWLSIKYNGRQRLVAVESLMLAWTKQQEVKDAPTTRFR